MNGHARDIAIDEQGGVIEIEEEVALRSLPRGLLPGVAGGVGGRGRRWLAAKRLREDRTTIF